MRPPRKLLWRLFFSYLFIALGALFAAGWHFVHTLEKFFEEQLTADLFGRARLIEPQIRPLLDPVQAPAVDAVCKLTGRNAGTRFSVILPDGSVVGDTWVAPESLDNHAGRPEIAEALAAGSGRSRRYSHTLRQNVLYAAIALDADGHRLGVIRAAIPLSRMEAQIGDMRLEFLAVGGVIALLALGVTLFISRQYGLKIDELKEGAARLARGELGHRLRSPDSEELGGLAESLNRMAEELESRLLTVTRQRNELEAVLSSMLEGVLAVDRNERILSLNPAAARWFDLDAERVRGKTVPEAIRNLAIQQFIAQALRTPGSFEEDITVYRGGERTLNIKSTPLRGAGDEMIGVLIVFSDVTRLRRLEEVRRDFVANVSHEIKTPLTAIQGFVETLQQHGTGDPEETARFLRIIARHANRLNAIVDDLLLLSRIENEGERGELTLQTVRLRELFQGAAQVCRPKAEARRIDIAVAVDPQLTLEADPVLLEQAVVNLLDNAIKYSDPGQPVQLRGRSSGTAVIIEVQDQGIGIEKKHLPRLFERFYRVDKARSRSQGGTGLGLAIVKHIAQAHGGRVTVESRVGEGSLFRLELPRGRRREAAAAHQPNRPVM
ncbi:MAG: ATP-binding protein [Desulfobacterales bacterium]